MQLGILYAALSGVLYGSIGFFGARLLQSGFTVSDLLFWRFLSSCFLLAPFALPPLFKTGYLKQHRKQLVMLLLLGGLFYGSSTSFYFESVRYIGTGLSMVIFYSYPLFVVGLSAFIKREKASIWTLLALACIVIGCTMIAFGEDFTADLEGVVLALLSGFTYGFYVFGTKSGSKHINPLIASFVVCLGNTFAFIVTKLWTHEPFQAPLAQEQMWLTLGFGAIGTVLPILLLLKAMKTLSANKVAIISVLEPVTTLLVGAIALHETVAFIQAAGAIVVLAGAMFVQLDKSAESPIKTPSK